MLRSSGCAAALLPAVQETITKAVLTGEGGLLRATLAMMLCCDSLRCTELKGHRSMCRTLQALQSKAEGKVGEAATWRWLDEAAAASPSFHAGRSRPMVSLAYGLKEQPQMDAELPALAAPLCCLVEAMTG